MSEITLEKLRSDFLALRDASRIEIAAKDREIESLKERLAAAEMMSAAKLGVPPVQVASRFDASGDDAYTRWKEMPEGQARDEYFTKNKAAIWAAQEKRAK